MQIERKNIRVRKEMAANGIDQRKLATIMHISEQELSIALKRELAKPEQDIFIAAIRECAANTKS